MSIIAGSKDAKEIELATNIQVILCSFYLGLFAVYINEKDSKAHLLAIELHGSLFCSSGNPIITIKVAFISTVLHSSDTSLIDLIHSA